MPDIDEYNFFMNHKNSCQDNNSGSAKYKADGVSSNAEHMAIGSADDDFSHALTANVSATNVSATNVSTANVSATDISATDISDSAAFTDRSTSCGNANVSDGDRSSDTIAAISTAATPAGIGVIRISGDNACKIADSVFHSANGKALCEMRGYRAAYGHVYDADELIDEAVALKFAAPHSYTGEETVEISCHGGTYILRKTLRSLLNNGARLAEPGEFTRRAFMNGKLDLTEAESVMDLIGADSEQAHYAAISAREGATFDAVEKAKSILLDADSSIAAWSDFPDEGVPDVDGSELSTQLQSVKEQLELLIATADSGRIIRDGINTVIAGKPNVGKSTVMNLLARCNRSIVTDIAGTTRDVIEETVNVGGIKLRLADTAGLHDTSDPVEAVGVDLASNRIGSAELIIAVFDGSREPDDNDINLINLIKNRRHVSVVNKSDLPTKFTTVDKLLPDAVVISAKNDSPEELEKAIVSAIGVDQFDPSAGVISNERQLDCARRAGAAVNDALNALASGITLDAVGVCIDDAVAALCELTGENVSENVVDRVFSRFCVGK